MVLKKETLLAFPDFTKPFLVYTETSDRQLGASVVQDGKPLGFHTSKLKPKKTTQWEKESCWELWKVSKCLKVSS